ncbi:hypothetical protein NE237_014253 [Protea cynaroides]|uniref:Uncharacterized protein n=1 Tax=Protea cynaroides TaxID=273540 RepID=A0A9Q0GKY1_9MAGN|nr:hypothetical protein NE237_014253 [Protea cynaroides]
MISGGPDGFELVSRFCYNNGRITIISSNVSLLHCSAIFLEITEKVSTYNLLAQTCNLLQQTEIVLEGLFYWSWNDILMCLKNCSDSLHLQKPPQNPLRQVRQARVGGSMI